MKRSVFTSLCLLGCLGCGIRPETDDRRIVHSGDFAVIRHANMPEVPVALSKEHAHALAVAVDTADEARVQEMVQSRKAVFVPAGTRVRITGESYNERRVEVIEGPGAGRTGWAPFEWFEFRRS